MAHSFLNLNKKLHDGKINHFEAFKIGNTNNFHQTLMQKIK